MSSIPITDVRFTPARRRRDRMAGLIGWVSFSFGAVVRVDGVAVRRTLGGHLRLSYPARRGHPFVRPLGDQARRKLEREIFAAITVEKEVGS